jgi:hypothetical protein
MDMNMIHEIVEIIAGSKLECREIHKKNGNSCENCSVRQYGENCVHYLSAMNLVKSGMIQLKWTPVTEGLPRNSEKYESYLVEVCESHWPTCSCDPCDAPYSTEYVDVARYDSDQKLWYIGSPEITLNALLAPDDAPLNGMCVLAWAEMPT